jgi:hypothetical protein
MYKVGRGLVFFYLILASGNCNRRFLGRCKELIVLAALLSHAGEEAVRLGEQVDGSVELDDPALVQDEKPGVVDDPGMGATAVNLEEH